MNDDRHIMVMGKRYRLRFMQRMTNLGTCEHPEAFEKQIRIRRSLRGRERLDTIIHELTHAGAWHWDEGHVEQFATDVAAVLWNLGYRAPGDE